MARQLEIRVFDEGHFDKVLDTLTSQIACGICEGGAHGDEQITEIVARDMFMVYVLCQPKRVGPILEELFKVGCGKKWGIITVTTIDAIIPRFEIIGQTRRTDEEMKLALLSEEDKPSAVAGAISRSFKGAFRRRGSDVLTTEEIYNNILSGAAIDANTWILLFSASVLAGAGVATDNSVSVVAAMLVSPMMGPLLAIAFAFSVNDRRLLWLGISSELKMCGVAFGTGVVMTMLVFGQYSTDFGWPNPQMQGMGNAVALVTAVFAACVSGLVLGVSVTSGGVNSFIGVAISASLLPPIVNSGMLLTFALVFESKTRATRAIAAGSASVVFTNGDLVHMGLISFVLFVINVVLICAFANLVFYLKGVARNFVTDEDADWYDALMLRGHQGLSAVGSAGGRVGTGPSLLPGSRVGVDVDTSGSGSGKGKENDSDAVGRGDTHSLDAEKDIRAVRSIDNVSLDLGMGPFDFSDDSRSDKEIGMRDDDKTASSKQIVTFADSIPSPISTFLPANPHHTKMKRPEDPIVTFNPFASAPHKIISNVNVTGMDAKTREEFEDFEYFRSPGGRIIGGSNK